jgi:hypothetical protein
MVNWRRAQLFAQARDVYPRYDFARMGDDEYGATLDLG